MHELTEVAGVRVNLFQHSLAHGTPDAVFPNNWFSTHPAGEGAGGVKEDTLVLYPMKCPNRWEGVAGWQCVLLVAAAGVPGLAAVDIRSQPPCARPASAQHAAPHAFPAPRCASASTPQLNPTARRPS